MLTSDFIWKAVFSRIIAFLWPVHNLFLFLPSNLYCTNPSVILYKSPPSRSPSPSLHLFFLSSSRFLHFSGGGGRSAAALHHWCEGGRISFCQRFIKFHLHQITPLKHTHCEWIIYSSREKRQRKMHWLFWCSIIIFFKGEFFTHDCQLRVFSPHVFRNALVHVFQSAGKVSGSQGRWLL